MKENWKQVGEIFTNALLRDPEARAEYISRECGNDRGMLNEVKSLLSSHESADNFLESPAVCEVAETFVDDIHILNEGDSLQHYKIVKQIGVGGMGTVYLAKDTKLERSVAIKILSENFESGQSSLSRFFREAKAASALAHPNIMVIHEIGEFEGTHFIVSEYIKGETLTSLFKKSDYALVQVIDISIQILNALAAAHKTGLVHRDIKPDNIMLRDDGIVKILDFGLVKRVDRKGSSIDFDAQTRELVNTKAGMVLGTAAYMSPEQARGRPIDSRTDIWSFGVVLFQMLSKKLPFHGDTTSDIIASILKSDPVDLKKLVPSIPDDLIEIIGKTLKKDADERYKSADEVVNELTKFRRQLGVETKTEPLKFRVSEDDGQDRLTDGKLTPVTADESGHESGGYRSFVSAAFTEVRAHSSYALLALVGFTLLTVAAYFGFSKLSATSDQSNPFQKMKLAKLTYEGRATDVVAISPNGKYISYVLDDEGRQSLVVRQVETDGVVELVPPKDVDYNCIEFSPDGNKVFYSVDSYSGGHKLYSISVLGGEPRKILDSLDYRFAISPNGKEIAFVRGKTSVALADIDGNNERVIMEAPNGKYFSEIAWNPDAQTILVSMSTRGVNKVFLATISTDGRKVISTSPDSWRVTREVKWTKDGKGIILTARDTETEFSQVWYVSYPGWQRKRITNDFSRYKGIDLTKDGETLVAVKRESSYDIWTQDIKEGTPAKKIKIDERGDKGFSGVAYANNQIFYSVQKGHSVSLWRINTDGTGKKQLTFEKDLNYFPVVSSDEKRIVFVSRRSGNSEIWSMNLDGEDQIKLTNTNEAEGFVSISPDGKWYFYHRTDKRERSTIWKMKPDGSEQTQVTKDYSERPVISNDSKYFTCQYGKGTADHPAKIAIFSIGGGEPIKLFDAPNVLRSRKYLWSSDDKSILYVDYIDRIGNIWAQPIDGGSPKQVTFFESGRIQRFSVDRKSGRFVLSRGNSSADVVSINNFK